MSKKRRILALVGLIVATMGVWTGARAYAAWHVRSNLKSAKDAIAAHAPRKAHRLLLEIEARSPGLDEVEFLLGACELSLGRKEAALSAWARVSAGSPFAASAALYRARLVLERDQFAVAENLLLSALAAPGPHANEARETLVHLYKLEGRFDEARALVLEVASTYRDPAGALREMEKLGSNFPMTLELIRSALEKASRNAPEDDRIWLGWANLATRTGRLEEAKRRLDECLRKRPDDAAVWKSWLDWALAREDDDEVKRAVRHLPAQWLGPAEVLSLQAWLAYRCGDVAREKHAHEALVAREPGSLRSLARLAEIAIAEGHPELAARLRDRRAELNRVKYAYQSAVNNLDPKNVRDAAKMAEALGRYIEAQTIWSLVAQSSPGDTEARLSSRRLRALEADRPKGPKIGRAHV